MEDKKKQVLSNLKILGPRYKSPIIYIGAFILIFCALIYSIYYRSVKEQATDVKILSERIVKNIELRLKGNLEFINLLSRERSEGNITQQSFQSHVNPYLADHPEFINITWVDSAFVIRTVSPLKGNSHIIGLHIELEEPKRASNLAYKTRHFIYTKPFEAIQGNASFEVWVPIFRGEKFLGFLTGVYSCSNLLKLSIPINKKYKTNFSLLTESNEIITEISQFEINRKNITYQAPMTSLGNGMMLKIEVQRSQPFTLITSLLILFCIILLTGFSFSLRKIKKEMRLRLRQNQELLNANNQLKDLENRMQFALMAGKLGTWDWDIETGKIIWSDTSKIMSGIPHDAEIDFDYFLNTVLEEDRDKIKDLVFNSLKDKKDYVSEYRVKWPDGSIHWLRVMGHGIYNDQGNPVRMIGVGMEITESKHAALELEYSHKLMSYIIQYNPSSIAVFDKNLRYVYVSESYLKNYKVKESDIIGKYHYDVFTDLPERFKDAHKRSLQGEIQGADEDPYYREDGSVTWTHWECRPWYEADGGIGGIILYTEDITERIQQKLELIAAKEKAEESDRLKTAFLQNMSHEIRTPMNAIMGFSSLLKESFENKKKLEQYANIINQRSNDLLAIISDILDIAKIESGQVPVNHEEFNLLELFNELNDLFTDYRDKIGKEHISFYWTADCREKQCFIITDKVKLKQILTNLISNAFKFTEAGKIEAGFRFKEKDTILFYVSDTGVGIPRDKQEVIFERFIQLNQNPGNTVGGTGLGLPIVKGLVNLLGGEVFLESEVNMGTRFYFTITYKPGKNKAPEIPKNESFDISKAEEKTILIVEDDFFNAEYIKEILGKCRLQFVHAETGEEAIEIARTQKIDMILMDIRLPGMDGYEATRLILRQNPGTKIIAQTAYASSDERQKALDAGCVDFISKPAKKEKLLGAIGRMMT